MEDLRRLADEWESEIDEGEVLRDYADLCEQLGCDATPDGLRSHGDNYEPTLILKSEFEDYAQELAEDIGAIARDLAEDIGAINGSGVWPLNCIDWERAVQELLVDYDSIRFAGDDYYIQA